MGLTDQLEDAVAKSAAAQGQVVEVKMKSCEVVYAEQYLLDEQGMTEQVGKTAAGPVEVVGEKDGAAWRLKLVPL